jgi:hypothetical protein
VLEVARRRVQRLRLQRAESEHDEFEAKDG